MLLTYSKGIFAVAHGSGCSNWYTFEATRDHITAGMYGEANCSPYNPGRSEGGGPQAPLRVAPNNLKTYQAPSPKVTKFQ